MNNRELFEDGPKLVKCDGCGRYFEEQMLRKCRACGKSFCPDCRLTHDCRETAESREVPPAVIRGFDDRSSAGAYGASGQTDEAQTPHHHIELTFIDTDGSSIGGASLREKPSFGSSHRYDSEGRPISFNDPADVSIGSADLKRYDETKVYGDDRYAAPASAAPAPAPRTVYPPQQTPEEPLQSQQPQPLYTPMPPQNSGCCPDEYSIPQQGRAAAGRTDVPPVFVYVAPAAPAAAPAAVPAAPVASPIIDTIPEPAEDELRCDDCGKVWKKSELRRCKKCGAVLCPECREKHKCGKKQKANAHNAENTPARREPKQNRQPRMRQGGKTANKKMIITLIVLLIFVVAIAIAAVMLVQNGQLTF